MRNSFRAIPFNGADDTMIVEQDQDGTVRYFRAQTDEKEEYGYNRPFILELEITLHCNLSCAHCYAHAQKSPDKNQLSLSEIERILDEAVELGIPELSLTGGEVLIHPKFFDIVDAGVNRGLNVRFVTNGTLIDEKILSQLCLRPIKLITVSLDGCAPTVHEKIRGLGTFLDTRRSILRLKDAGFNVSVITAFSRLNLQDFEGIYEFVVQNRLAWQVQLVASKGRCSKDIVLSPDEYYELGQKIATKVSSEDFIDIIPMDDMVTFSHFEPLKGLCETWQGRCSAGMLNLFVRANGDITPCSALCFEENVVGNIRSDSLIDVCKEERCKINLSWVHSKSNKTGACKDCPFWEKCYGGCPEMLLSMCRERTENEYCYHRIEQQRILNELFTDDI